MNIKVVVFNVDELVLEEKGLDFETEMDWLHVSNITHKKIFEIPDELNQHDPIETIWIMKQVQKTLDSLKENKEIDSYNDELIKNIVLEFQNNIESIEQDLDWKVRDYLRGNKR